MGDPFIHPTADVSPNAKIGVGARIWNNVQIREGVTIGEECIIGKDTYVDKDVILGSRVKVQNGAQLYQPLTIENGVFIGPHAVFTNDRTPRAVTPAGALMAETIHRVGEEPLKAELKSFFRAIEAGEEPEAGGEVGLAAVELADEILARATSVQAELL